VVRAARLRPARVCRVVVKADTQFSDMTEAVPRCLIGARSRRQRGAEVSSGAGWAGTAVLRHAADMTESDPQPRDIALEQETPELAADLDAQSEPDDPGTDDPGEISEGRS